MTPEDRRDVNKLIFGAGIGAVIAIIVVLVLSIPVILFMNNAGLLALLVAAIEIGGVIGFFIMLDDIT